MSEPRGVEIVEVGPRDGFQAIAPFILTATKIDFVQRLAACGLNRIEIGSFVSEAVLPQFRDTPDVLAAAIKIPGLIPQVLVPNRRRGMSAIDAGATRLVFVISVSNDHNQQNVHRSRKESVREYQSLLSAFSGEKILRLDIATAFDCPFTGLVPNIDTLELLAQLVSIRSNVEICLCDTTGRGTPEHVADLFGQAATLFPEVSAWAFHGHDTYGTGLANLYAAYRAGVRIFDASFAGLGGCPFAPGATGNVATEDAVWLFERMGILTGVDLDALLLVSRDGASLSGGTPGGRVRQALQREIK